MHIIPLKHGAIVCGESLAHYGTPRHSGRYPWGSGENPYHHGQSVPRLNVRKTREEIKSLKKQEKLHKRAGRSDWHDGKFSSRKLHRQEAADIKARREKLQKLLDEHIPMDRTEKLAKGTGKHNAFVRNRLANGGSAIRLKDSEIEAAHEKIRKSYSNPKDLSWDQIRSEMARMRKERSTLVDEASYGLKGDKLIENVAYTRALNQAEQEYFRELKRRMFGD